MKEFKMTPYQKAIMRALIDDEKCMEKLIIILNEIQLKAWETEQSALKLRKEQKELEELIIYLNTPREETK